MSIILLFGSKVKSFVQKCEIISKRDKNGGAEMEKMLKEKIKELRLANRYTEEYVAKYLGTTQAVVWKYESGKTEKIPMDVIKKLCLLYHVSADYLLGLPRGLEYPEE